MANDSPATLRPSAPGAKTVCVIDTDETFLALLEDFLSEQCRESAKLVGMYSRIPEDQEELRQADVVIINPYLPEFRDIDGIARVQLLYGDRVRLMARLSEGASERLREDLEVSGVRYFVQANDFSSIVGVLNMLAITPLSIPPIEPDLIIRVDGSEPPPEPTRLPVHVCIVAEDPLFAKMLGLVLLRDMGNDARVEGVFDHIPQSKDLTDDVTVRLVIFDPEAHAFRDLAGGISRLRTLFGTNALIVARTDNWRALGNPHSNGLLKAGIQAGCSREDYVGFVRLAIKLSNGTKPTSIGT